MKKLYLILIGLFVFVAPAAQAQIGGKSVKDYTTKKGTTFHVGDTIYFAAGTMDNGNYRYIYQPMNVWASSPQMQFGSQWNGRQSIIKDLRLQESKKYGSKTVAAIATGGFNGCVDLESAEDAGEIRTRNNRKAAPAQAAAAAPSVADELLKLKSLLDAGALTKEEYDAQKAKLLAK